MKKIFLSLLFLTFTLPLSVLFAADVMKRSAIIVDKSGNQTEVTDLYFAGSNALNNKVLSSPDDIILIETEPLIIGIPLDRLISVELEGKTYNVTYSSPIPIVELLKCCSE